MSQTQLMRQVDDYIADNFSCDTFRAFVWWDPNTTWLEIMYYLKKYRNFNY